MTCQSSQKNPNGRPREHNREQIAQDLIEWAKKDDSINLNAFCCSREPCLDPAKLSLWSREDEKFRQSYRAAKAFLGARREAWLSTEKLHQTAYNRNVRVYDFFERDESRDEFKFQKEIEAKVGKELAQTASADIVERLDKMHSQLDELQSSSKIAVSNNNSDK